MSSYSIEALVGSGWYTEALALANERYQHDPFDMGAVVELVYAYSHCGYFQEALDLCDRLVALPTEGIEVDWHRAQIAMLRGQYAEAQRTFATLDHPKLRLTSLVGESRCQQYQGDYNAAISTLAKAVVIGPSTYDVIEAALDLSSQLGNAALGDQLLAAYVALSKDQEFSLLAKLYGSVPSGTNYDPLYRAYSTWLDPASHPLPPPASAPPAPWPPDEPSRRRAGQSR